MLGCTHSRDTGTPHYGVGFMNNELGYVAVYMCMCVHNMYASTVHISGCLLLLALLHTHNSLKTVTPHAHSRACHRMLITRPHSLCPGHHPSLFTPTAGDCTSNGACHHHRWCQSGSVELECNHRVMECFWLIGLD